MSDDLRELAEAAQRHADARRWDDAADHLSTLADRAEAEGRTAMARWAWDACGEAWRRGDRPPRAARALRRALALPGDPAEAVTARVKLAGVLQEVGALSQAEVLCVEALDRADECALKALALDTLVGVLQATGRKEGARDLVERLEGLEHPAARQAAAFRGGQLLRLDGRLGEAARAFGALLEGLESRPEAQAGRAAVRGEVAEIALHRGDPGPAVVMFEASAAAQEEAGRPSLRWRAEAGRVRAMVEAGVAPMPGLLDAGLRYAMERGMRVLALDLALARGMSSAARAPGRAARDLEQAVAEADALGLALRAGRARYEQATRLALPPSVRVTLLEQSLIDLADHVPLSLRARLALADALAPSDPIGARSHAAAVLARASALELDHLVAIARERLMQVG